MSERNANLYLERILPHRGDRQRIGALLERRWAGLTAWATASNMALLVRKGIGGFDA